MVVFVVYDCGEFSGVFSTLEKAQKYAKELNEEYRKQGFCTEEDDPCFEIRKEIVDGRLRKIS